MALETNVWFADALENAQVETDFQVKVIIAAFRGFNTSVISMATDGRLYAAGRGGTVVRLGTPRMHLELRRTPRDSTSSMGFDADTVEVTYRDVPNGFDLVGRISMAQAETVRVSHCVGYGLAKVLEAARAEAEAIREEYGTLEKDIEVVVEVVAVTENEGGLTVDLSGQLDGLEEA
jgi:hypothetical protein